MMRTLSAPLAGAAIALVAGASLAQPVEVVTVEAARTTTVGQSAYGVPIRAITVTSRVSYADLDLTTETGALELRNRVQKTAKSACEQIKVDIPAEGSTTEGCIKDAVKNAMKDVDAAVAAKRAKAK